MKKIKQLLSDAVHSIAFYPAMLSLLFLILSIVLLAYDDSESGRRLKVSLSWLRLKDAATARSVVSTAVSGLMTLTVFSFTMVMVVLTQAATQMSNRVLDNLIDNRFQQIVLGFYVGTIVYALMLLSAIRDIDSGVSVPAISIFTLIAFTITAIFMFVYFLHFVTRSVRYQTVIHRITDQTRAAMKKSCPLRSDPAEEPADAIESLKVFAGEHGIYTGFDREQLLNWCEANDASVAFPLPPGTFVLTNTVLCRVYNVKSLSDNLRKELLSAVNIHREENVFRNYLYGFRQLTEVAVKALSPGINDPGTAVQALQGLTTLLSFRQKHFPTGAVRDAGNRVRIYVRERTFREIFESTILTVWDYGKEDRTLLHAMHQLLAQLRSDVPQPEVDSLLRDVEEKLAQSR